MFGTSPDGFIPYELKFYRKVEYGVRNVVTTFKIFIEKSASELHIQIANESD